MFVLSLFTCVVLGAFSAQAKVVKSFGECKEFFYKGKEPSGMDQNAKRICQKMQNDSSASSYFATLYSSPHRIPLYSAYTFDPGCSTDAGRTSDWHIEPQISNPSSETDYMVPEKDIDVRNAEGIKQFQAMSSHYMDTGYDRGHLNPNSFHCDDNRTTTFTLTNAVPMDACFNPIYWKSWESALRSFLRAKLASDGGSATVYIVTGAVPDENVRIPKREISQDPEKVTVPSHIWTAVCYKHLYDDEKSLSFGYIGKNQPSQPDINMMSVSELNVQLSELYRQLPYQLIGVFADDCFGDNNKLNLVYEKFKKLINLPVNNVVQMSTDIQIKYNAVRRTVNSEGSPQKRVKVKEMTVKLGFDSISEYYTVIEELKVSAGSACLITNNELRMTYVSEVSDAVECLMVPEKQMTAADGSPCSDITDSVYRCDCYEGNIMKSCCSSPCLYQGKLKSYRCYSGQTLEECSPRYSLITANGKRCMDDHPCATYGKDYYWCRTGYDIFEYFWDYCSPPLWQSKAKNRKYCRSNHACAKYGKEYRWCYTDKENNYDKCCISEDCYSTVTDKKQCRQDHPCGYHNGTKYLWCYTDYEDNYEYCCTECDKRGNILLRKFNQP